MEMHQRNTGIANDLSLGCSVLIADRTRGFDLVVRVSGEGHGGDTTGNRESSSAQACHGAVNTYLTNNQASQNTLHKYFHSPPVPG